MQKTAKQIQGRIYRLLRESALAREITGGVYLAGMRPAGSRLEDAVVIFTAGRAAQVQTAVVTVRVYVPDIAGGDGVTREDGKRTGRLEQEAQRWADTLTTGATTGWLVRLRETIHTAAEPDISQHAVTVILSVSVCCG